MTNSEKKHLLQDMRARCNPNAFNKLKKDEVDEKCRVIIHDISKLFEKIDLLDGDYLAHTDGKGNRPNELLANGLTNVSLERCGTIITFFLREDRWASLDLDDFPFRDRILKGDVYKVLARMCDLL